MSQPIQSQKTPPANSKGDGEKKWKRKRNRQRNKGNGATLESRKGKGKAIDATTVNSATIFSRLAQPSTFVSINASNTPPQNKQAIAANRGKDPGASHSNPNAINPTRPTLVGFSPTMQIINRKKRRRAGNHREDQKQGPAAVRAVIEPHLFSIAQILPVDVLSIITLECSREKWIAPLAISQVCRLWRTAALATPAAWACIQIDPHNPPGPKFLDLWLSRCGALTCQLSFPPWGTFPSLKVACSRAELLKGLSVFRSTQVFTRPFPNLEELRVSGYHPKPPREWKGSHIPGLDVTGADKRKPSLLQVSRFPSLRVLHLHSLSNIVMKSIARQGLPPLEELHIHATHPKWEDVVAYCADSLVTLGIRYDQYNINRSAPKKLTSITLPRLECLSIVLDYIHTVPVNNHQLTTFQTPSLRAYHEKQVVENPLLSPIHQDTLTVTTATFVGANQVDWAKLPFLTHMTLHVGDLYCRNLCDSLGDKPMQASRLSEIQWVSDDPLQMNAMRQTLEKRRRVNGKMVNLRSVRESTYRPPREFHETCFTYLPAACGSNTGDIFDEVGELAWKPRSDGDLSDNTNDYLHYGDYDWDWDSNPYGPGSGDPAGIDSGI